MSEPATKLVKDDFHRERSRFLDAFAGLEEVLLRSTSTVMDKRLSDQLKALRAIRNDLVHSQLRFVQLEGQLQALAVNAQNSAQTARPARLLRVDDFTQLQGSIAQLKRELEQAA